ncbi:hypothetical protein [Streptomyces europaeiscabiei]|uniref:hypothetical protein n=1 Tax=Streptomyces europaeiscabiei TaxID=146819 RepID=UPI0029BF329C|nr:hypothetical protein [Streptomyces europaeiscabiei]MDX3589237.1 hypothetical protein [Streptomyces europaeiscabiei]MDX3614802.1 hypothetical protein [Streptomyces europaeiscabiei]
MSLIQLLPSGGTDAVGPYLPSNAVMTVRTTGDSLSPGSGLALFALFALFACHIVVVLVGAAVLLEQRDA